MTARFSGRAYQLSGAQTLVFCGDWRRVAEWVTKCLILGVSVRRTPGYRSYQTLADQLLNIGHGNYVSRRQTRPGMEDNNLPGPNSEQEPLSLESFRVTRFEPLEAPNVVPSTSHDHGSGPLQFDARREPRDGLA